MENDFTQEERDLANQDYQETVQRNITANENTEVASPQYGLRHGEPFTSEQLDPRDTEGKLGV